MSRFLSYDNEADQSLALMALAASPTPEEAVEYLAAEYNITCVPSKLVGMAKFRREQYEELRQKIAPLKEKQLANNLLDNAVYASEVTMQAVQQLQAKVDEGRVPAESLSRVARDLADVQAKAVDKRLALEGRPTVITETRSAPEIIRKLEHMGVVNSTATEIGPGEDGQAGSSSSPGS